MFFSWHAVLAPSRLVDMAFYLVFISLYSVPLSLHSVHMSLYSVCLSLFLVLSSLYSVLFLHLVPLSLYSVVSALYAMLWTPYLHGASFSWRRRSGYGSPPSWLVHSDSFKTWNQFWMNWASLGTLTGSFEVEIIDPEVVESLTDDN